MLRNHGLLTVAETVADAFLYMYIFERTCSIQVAAQAGGNPLIPISNTIVPQRGGAAEHGDEGSAWLFAVARTAAKARPD